jgi:hypothetical protein
VFETSRIQARPDHEVGRDMSRHHIAANSIIGYSAAKCKLRRHKIIERKKNPLLTLQRSSNGENMQGFRGSRRVDYVWVAGAESSMPRKLRQSHCRFTGASQWPQPIGIELRISILKGSFYQPRPKAWEQKNKRRRAYKARSTLKY